MDAPPELMIVMPAYNEHASLRKVVLQWFQEVENWTENFVFLAINDGSTDGTPAVLARLQEKLGPRFECVHQSNKGHGQSCLVGYRQAIDRKIPYVFQIDSDGQCDPQYFFRFWREREKYGVIYGVRTRRDDGWRRVAASLVLKLSLLVFVGVRCVDANVPYRLMKTACLEKILDRIPPSFVLANIALSVLMRKDPSIREKSIPIRFRERYGGEPSVKLSAFGTKAIELFSQLRRL